MEQKLTFLASLLFVAMSSASAQSYDVNERGTQLVEINNRAYPGQSLTVEDKSVVLSDQSAQQSLWRVTPLNNGYMFLDYTSATTDWDRLLATRYMPARVTKGGVEGRNRDVQFRATPSPKKGWSYIEHNTSGRYLTATDSTVVLTTEASKGSLWQLDLKKLDVEAMESPIIMMGDDNTAFRDPAVIYKDGTFYMYYSIVKTEEDEKLYWYVGYSKSTDLINWSDPVIITEKDQSKNFGSPGNVIRFGNEWIICMQTYVIKDYKRSDKLRFGGRECRLWIMRSKDLEHWSEPEMLWVKGKGVDPGSMIDAYLVEDKDEKGKWWCFYKHQNISHYSYTYNMKDWIHVGSTKSGENACVWIEDDTYHLMTSPERGMNIQTSKDLKNWDMIVKEEVLGQKDWGSWAGQRVTAGFVMNMRDNPTIGKYLMFFHGQGPAPKTTEVINSGCDLGLAWSDDFIHWEWAK